jgi:hypothetical protein
MANAAMQPLSSYPGTLILDNNANHSWVQRPVGPVLLMLDPNQSGVFSWGQVNAAWLHYATVANGQSGVIQINPQGFVPLNGNLMVVHVVVP